jgi:hypothetical protein
MTNRKEIRNLLLNLKYYAECEITHIFTERNLRMEVRFLKDTHCYSLLVSVPAESVFDQQTMNFHSIDYAAGAIEQILFNNDYSNPYSFNPAHNDLLPSHGTESISIQIKGKEEKKHRKCDAF